MNICEIVVYKCPSYIKEIGMECYFLPITNCDTNWDIYKKKEIIKQNNLTIQDIKKM